MWIWQCYILLIISITVKRSNSYLSLVSFVGHKPIRISTVSDTGRNHFVSMSAIHHRHNRRYLKLQLSKQDDSDNDIESITDNESNIQSIMSIENKNKLVVDPEANNNNIDSNNSNDNDTLNLTPQYITLALLLLIFSSNQWCRQAIYYLCNFGNNGNSFLHMNIDLNFNSEMYAFLASFAFTAIFSVFSLLAGNFADKYNRKNIIVISCFVWSIVTLLQSQTTSFYQLVPLRIILGMSQAFFNPAAYTLLSDIFPKNLVGKNII